VQMRLIMALLSAVFLTNCSSGGAGTLKKCLHSLSSCTAVTANDSEVCEAAKRYEIWPTRESEAMMREAISRGLSCANTAAGRALAPSPNTIFGEAVKSSKTDKSEAYKRAKESMDKFWEQEQERYNSNPCGVGRLYC
jgi:hypothetical protein